jgi:AcrR family transcriptional regulator
VTAGATAGPPTKERIRASAGELFRRQGYSATGIKQIVEQASAPFASVYHFFPGGKEELGADVVRTSGAMYQGLVEAVWDAAPDVVASVHGVFAAAADTLVATGYADACPIATVALEVASTNERLRLATAEVFDAWIESATARLHAAGIDRRRARELAFVIVALLEGAFVLARAGRTTEPLRAAGASAARAVEAALEAALEAAPSAAPPGRTTRAKRGRAPDSPPLRRGRGRR